MNIIHYIRLFKYLSSQQDFPKKDILRTILRIRQLPRRYKLAILDLMDGYTPDISERGVALNSLIEDDGMAPVQAILFMDWLRRDPSEATHFMAYQSHSCIMPDLDEETSAGLAESIERLSALVGEQERKNIEDRFNPAGLDDKSDINCE